MVETLQNLRIYPKFLLVPLDLLPKGPQHKVELDTRFLQHL